MSFHIRSLLCVLLVTSLIPDVLMNKYDSTNMSLHQFNPPPIAPTAHSD